MTIKRDAKEGDTWDVASYDDLHPGRFLKNSHLEGKPVTLTIRKIHAEHMGKKKTGGDDIRGILSFSEIPEQYACQVTNEVLLKALFGEDPKALPGKRVTLGPAMVRGLGGKMVPGIRVVGSPDMTVKSLAVEVAFVAKSQRPKENHVLRRTTPGPHPVYATQPTNDARADAPAEPTNQKPRGDLEKALATIEKWAGDPKGLQTGLNGFSWTGDEKAAIKAAIAGKESK